MDELESPRPACVARWPPEGAMVAIYRPKASNDRWADRLLLAMHLEWADMIDVGCAMDEKSPSQVHLGSQRNERSSLLASERRTSDFALANNNNNKPPMFVGV